MLSRGGSGLHHPPLVIPGLDPAPGRHCERSEAISRPSSIRRREIASSLALLAMTAQLD
jgi:hypothetical protein